MLYNSGLYILKGCLDAFHTFFYSWDGPGFVIPVHCV